MMLWIVLLCCLCALWCFRQWRWLQLTSWIPNLPGNLPIIGIAHQTLGNSECLWSRIESWSYSTNELGGIGKVRLGPLPLMVVTDSDIASSVMNSCLQKHPLYLFAASVFGDGLVTSDVSVWKRHRKLLSPAFTQHVIDDFLQVFNKQSELLVKALKEKAGKGEFNHSPYVVQRALETICQTAFGLPTDRKSIVTVEYANAMCKIFETLIKRATTVWLYPNFIFKRSFIKKEETEAKDIIKKMSAKIIATGKITKKIESSYDESQNNINRRFKPFFELMMDLDEKGYLSDSEIREETDTFITAGYDTTSTSLTILLVILGSHPAVQDRAYREVMTVFAESSKSITKEGLSKLVYLEAVIKETLRLYPTIPLVARTVDKKLKFGEFIVPEGMGFIVSIWGANRNKKYWGISAEEFRPERWLEPSTLPEHPAAFCSFSLGRRSCIGKSYAITSLKTSLAHILRAYRLRADHTKMKFKWEVTMKPASGYFISIETR